MTEIILQEKDVHTGNLILVNPKYAYEEQERHHLVPLYDTEVFLEQCAADSLFCLLAHIGGARQIVPVSGFRTMEEQQQIWDGSLAEHGQSFTETYVAVPGHSEHQTGLAIDLGKNQENIDFIRPEFPYDGICQTFREHAASYGFIERYPKESEQMTGIGHEPWHFRYVGTPHAAIIKEHGFILEEYISFLRQFPYGQKAYVCRCGQREAGISFVKADANGSARIETALETVKDMEISGNNADGFIVTEWRRAYA